MNYHLIQFLTGYDGYKKHMFRFGIDDSPFCPEYPGTEEDPEHVLFHCPRFASARESLELGLKCRLSVGNLISKISGSEEVGIVFQEVLVSIHSTLRRAEMDRRIV